MKKKNVLALTMVISNKKYLINKQSEEEEYNSKQ